MYTFGIFMTTLLSGKLYSCQLEHTSLTSLQKIDLIKTKWDCLSYGGEWENDDANFDNIVNSMRNIFVLQTNEHLR